MFRKLLLGLIILVSLAQAHNYNKKYINSCLNNIGNDVKTKNWISTTFKGEECGITMYGNGISLLIKLKAFNALKTNYKSYILNKLNYIAKKYGFQNYSILLSHNEKKLTIDDEIESHEVHYKDDSSSQVKKIMNKKHELYFKYKQLIWQDSPINAVKYMKKNQAYKYCKKLNYLGYTNWRLPTIQEMLQICPRFSDYPLYKFKYLKLKDWYWTSSNLQFVFSTGAENKNLSYPALVRCVAPRK